MSSHVDRKRIMLGAVVAILTVVSVGFVILATSPRTLASKGDTDSAKPPAVTMTIEYAAKFVCGIPTTEAQREGVKPGNYATAINIRNSHQLPATPPISFTKHAVLAQPEGFNLTPPSHTVSEMLPSDFAMEADCTNIRVDMLGLPSDTTFIKGFLVILTPPPADLDVIGVYSSETPPLPGSTTPGGMGLEILPIAPRTITK
jgi:hypothetical protein